MDKRLLTKTMRMICNLKTAKEKDKTKKELAATAKLQLTSTDPVCVLLVLSMVYIFCVHYTELYLHMLM